MLSDELYTICAPVVTLSAFGAEKGISFSAFVLPAGKIVAFPERLAVPERLPTIVSVSAPPDSVFVKGLNCNPVSTSMPRFEVVPSTNVT